jgi:hypothetical protein
MKKPKKIVHCEFFYTAKLESNELKMKYSFHVAFNPIVCGVEKLAEMPVHEAMAKILFMEYITPISRHYQISSINYAFTVLDCVEGMEYKNISQSL